MTGQRYDAFVSAVSSEFGRARDAAAAELRKHGRHVAVQSDFVPGPAGFTLLRRLHDTIRDCAEVHCIVGTRSGACPSAAEAAAFARFLPEETAEASYTQWEFFFARHYAPERTWLYLAGAAWPPDEPAPEDEQPALQARFLDYLRQCGADHANFANLGELRAEMLGHALARDAEALAAAEHAPHEPLHRSIVANTVGGLIVWAVSTALTLAVAQRGGPALVLLLLVPAVVLGAICAGAFVVLYRRYEAILARHDADARAAYDGLRRRLAEGGGAARVYVSSLRRALDAVDRFFGDAGMADRTLLPRAFGLRTPASLWTAPAFDRCLLLALLYPVAVVYVVWVTTGQVGPAEHAFRMQAGLPFWDRSWRLLAMTIAGYAFARGFSQEKYRWLLFGLAIASAARLLGSLSGFTGMIIGMIFPEGGLIGAGFITMLLGLLVWAALAAGAGHFLISAAYLTLGVLSLLVAPYLAIVNNPGARHALSRGPVQIVLVVVFISVCMVGAMLSRSPSWNAGAPLILFLGLLPFLNAPFDWAALGLTRALLRRGIELGKWWPYLLAMVDAVVAAIVIAALTAVCVLGVQAFDDIAARSGGESTRVLPLNQLFDGIAANPGAPQYWWAYAMLLSTMIPSLLNLMIGGASLLRGIPWLTTALLRAMPEHRAPRSFDRTWITLVLTGQVFVGAILGIAAQAFLVYVVIGLLLPVFGLDLLGLARAVAAPDLPGTLIHWVLGPPAH